MSGPSVISEVTAELRRRLFEAFRALPDDELGVSSLEDIALGPPKDLGQSVVASLYLYLVDIDEHLRNQPPRPDRDDQGLVRRPPLPVRLHYLFTPVSREEETNHILLGRFLQHFHDFPTFSTLDGTPIGDSFGGAPSALRATPEPLTIEQLSHLWTGFTAPLRVAVPLRVESVAVDSGEPPRRSPRAGQVLTAVGWSG
ncbi:DUF4255 domain-containing protein [Actinoplanes sp. NPDC049596]|uniref:DUF4255 domain-containing protein n=1 Tax=unclassified Actinoplanes TaxID=2626549 RepID=UPI0034355E2E